MEFQKPTDEDIKRFCREIMQIFRETPVKTFEMAPPDKIKQIETKLPTRAINKQMELF